MRQGSRSLVPTVLAAEVAIIGLLFVGHFTVPSAERPAVELELAIPATEAAGGEAVRPFLTGKYSPAELAPEELPSLPASVSEIALSGPETAPETASQPRAPIPTARVAAAEKPVAPVAPPAVPDLPPSLRVAAADAARDLETLIRPEIWPPRLALIDPLPLPDPTALRRAPELVARFPDAVLTDEAPADDAALASTSVDYGAGAIVPPRPAPPPARSQTEPQPVIIAVSARSVIPAPPPPPAVAAPPVSAEAPIGTVIIEGRVVACAILPERLQRRFASCGGAGAAESMVGTVEINGATIACDRL